jgi:putative heme iron utilization protein
LNALLARRDTKLSSSQTIRQTDDDARMLARQLIRASPFASLATLGADGFPLASLISVATGPDGATLLLVSRLSGHTGNLLARPRLSLLFARPGKGDPLAHPRISVAGEAEALDRDSAAGEQARRRFLARQPKAQLYVDFPDFLLVRVAIRSASLNGGFGKAYELTAEDLLTQLDEAEALVAAEAEILAHMNEDHADAVGLYATAVAGCAAGPWRMLSLDPDGFEIGAQGALARIAFPARVTTPEAARIALIGLARAARSAQGAA